MAAPVRLTTAEKVTFTLTAIPAGATMQNAVATSSDPAIATVVLNADGVTGVVTPTGVPGQMSVLVAAQNDAGEPISGQGDVTVTAVPGPRASAVDVVFDAPTPR